MYQFVLNLWIMSRLTAEQVQAFVARGYITHAEADMILATPQI